MPGFDGDHLVHDDATGKVHSKNEGRVRGWPA